MSAARSLHDRYAAWLMLERGLSDNTRAAYAADALRIDSWLAQTGGPPPTAPAADL